MKLIKVIRTHAIPVRPYCPYRPYRPYRPYCPSVPSIPSIPSIPCRTRVRLLPRCVVEGRVRVDAVADQLGLGVLLVLRSCCCGTAGGSGMFTHGPGKEYGCRTVDTAARPSNSGTCGHCTRSSTLPCSCLPCSYTAMQGWRISGRRNGWVARDTGILKSYTV